VARRRPSAPRQFSRTDRIGELVREIVASELERIGDERLELVTITAVDVDGSLEHAAVFYSALSAEEEGRSELVAEALEDQRWKVQQVVNRQVRARKTPQIRFRPDTVLSSALRIDEILRGLEASEAPIDDDVAEPDGRGDGQNDR
jgi:ribosome-binding factor A